MMGQIEKLSIRQNPEVNLLTFYNVQNVNFWTIYLVFVKSPTSDRIWPDNVFISGGIHRLISRFCGVVLGPTTFSKMVSEPLQDPLGHLLSGFRYRATHHLCSRTKPNSAGRERVC